jgi:class 3 adenylate cyclase
MHRRYLHPLLDVPADLASHRGWTEEVYRDLLALRAGQMSRAELDAKYLHRKAILVLDLTGFTVSCFDGGEVQAFLKILDAQMVCIPVLQQHDACLIRAFADDLVALFDGAGDALDAAFEMQRRIALFNECGLASGEPVQCCIGIGFGDVYAIGPNVAMGDEMNRASRLGEDIARGAETLVTANVREALRQRPDVVFESLSHDDMLFPYFRATPSS